MKGWGWHGVKSVAKMTVDVLNGVLVSDFGSSLTRFQWKDSST